MDNNSKFIIDYNDEGKRLDAYLSEMLVDISRSKIKKSEILVNSKGTKPSYQLRENDVIECGNFEAELHNIPPQNIPLDIIYEDENMLVVNKPSGMLTHPTTTEKENTLWQVFSVYHIPPSTSLSKSCSIFMASSLLFKVAPLALRCPPPPYLTAILLMS